MKVDFFEVKRKFGRAGTVIDLGAGELALIVGMWVDGDKLHAQVIFDHKIGQGSTDLLIFERQQVGRWRRGTAKEFSQELQRVFDKKDFGCSICERSIVDLATAEIVCPGCQQDQAALVYIDLAEIAA